MRGAGGVAAGWSLLGFASPVLLAREAAKAVTSSAVSAGTASHRIRRISCTRLGMQLRIARLCLDCDELHDAQQCPVCTSETFAYISRWVPVPERRKRPRPPKAMLTKTTVSRVAIGCGVTAALGLALTRWSRAARERLEAAATRNAGELR